MEMPSLGTKRLCWSTCKEPAFLLLPLLQNIVSSGHQGETTFSCDSQGWYYVDYEINSVLDENKIPFVIII